MLMESSGTRMFMVMKYVMMTISEILIVETSIRALKMMLIGYLS